MPVTSISQEPNLPAGRAKAAAARSVSLEKGRSSASPGSGGVGTFDVLRSTYAPLAYALPWEVLEYVEMLSTYNPDYSQAVDNVRTLANSGHDLFVDASSKGASRELKSRLEEKARTIQVRHGGIDGLIDKLLDQAATYGAMSGEWIMSEDLRDVVGFEEVNPKSIRFFWEPEANDWMPYQKVNTKQAEEAKNKGQKVINQAYVKLNPITYHYYAFDSAPGSPYGVPPFVAAMQNIAIQRDMIINMAQIVKKVGLLGIIDFIVQQLPPHPGETDEEFNNRANTYLDTYVEAVENMVRDGGIVHFDDSEVKSYDITGNAAGATAIFKQNEELIFSGLKSMPSVQGRSYSTTETYAGVAYDIIIRNTHKYQRACKRMIEAGYWLMAASWGFSGRAKTIKLDFHDNKTLQRLQDAQSEILEIKNSLMLWAAGVIDQITVAQRHGYDSVATEYDKPPDSQLLGNASPGGGAGANTTSTEAVQRFPEVFGKLERLRELILDLAKEMADATA